MKYKRKPNVDNTSVRPSVRVPITQYQRLQRLRLFTKFGIGFSLQMSSKVEFHENRHSCSRISLWRSKGNAIRHFHISWTVSYIRCI